MLKGRHIIEPGDLSVSEIDEICSLAEQILVDPVSFQDVCRGKILATLFFEPSTRTRLSFEAAMLHLGGTVEGFADASYTSSTKGETLADTIRVVSSYVDVIAMRSPQEGAALFKTTGKRIEIKSNKFEVVFDNQIIPINVLSSGEKQILLILLRVFLLEGKAAYVLLDEPENSLDISLQFELINNLVKLNPNAQYFITTHSPSIFGDGWGDKIIYMEDVTAPVK